MTAGLAEERRKDREEYRRLWRDTQRQLNENAVRINELTLKIADTNDAVSRLADQVAVVSAESRAADARLEQRIADLVSAIGKFVSERN